jgi:hypothetical protein
LAHYKMTQGQRGVKTIEGKQKLINGNYLKHTWIHYLNLEGGTSKCLRKLGLKFLIGKGLLDKGLMETIRLFVSRVVTLG